jgi:hypothetical protein
MGKPNPRRVARRAASMSNTHRDLIRGAMESLKENLEDYGEVLHFAAWINDNFDDFQEHLFAILENFDNPDGYGSMSRELRDELTDYPKRDYMSLARKIRRTAADPLKAVWEKGVSSARGGGGLTFGGWKKVKGKWETPGPYGTLVTPHEGTAPVQVVFDVSRSGMTPEDAAPQLQAMAEKDLAYEISEEWYGLDADGDLIDEMDDRFAKIIDEKPNSTGLEIAIVIWPKDNQRLKFKVETDRGQVVIRADVEFWVEDEKHFADPYGEWR